MTGLAVAHFIGEAAFGGQNPTSGVRQILSQLSLTFWQVFSDHIHLQRYKSFRDRWVFPCDPFSPHSYLWVYLGTLNDTKLISGFYTILYQHHYSSQQPKETSGSTLKMSSLWQATCLQTWVGTLTLSTRLHPQCWNQDPHWSIVNPLAWVALTIPDKFESQLINLPFPCGTHSVPLWLMWCSRSTWQACLDTVTIEPSPELCHCNAGRVK